MTASAKCQTMSAEAFLKWAEAQDGRRYQLIAGNSRTLGTGYGTA